MSASYIIAAAREVDGAGTLTPVEAKWNELREHGARLTELVIDPLEAGWSTPVAPNHFRSGCAPIEALAHANFLVRESRADAVLIRGEDFLRSRYADNKPLRQQQMAIYGDEYSIPEAYTRLAHTFIRRHKLSLARFMELAEALFENYVRTAQRNNEYKPPRPEAFGMVTELFRAVDCANPVVDFAGAVIVASSSLAGDESVKVLGVGLAQTGGDGPAHVEEIARYDHLQRACAETCNAARVDFSREFRAGRALLEAYTCFPVAPLGFLLASGIASNVDELLPLLRGREITVTGGMNLARAPWNNPALNALVVMYQRLVSGGAPLGAVHGNGGLGYRQGLAILGR